MKEIKNTIKPSFQQLVVLFLGEFIRSRRTSISRAAEISSRVISALKSVKTEGEVLSLLNNLEKDFEEIIALKQALHFGYNDSDISVYEKEIKEFAAGLFQENMVRSATFLQDAARPGSTIELLCLQYPDFCHVLTASDKGPLMAHLNIG